jgi:HK97 family phage portal protein
MGIISSLFEQRAAPAQNIDWGKYFGLREPTAAGVHVDHSVSLQQSTVFACQRVLAESVAMLPLILYRRLPRGKERATDQGLYSILHDLPNPEMTSMELREVAMGHLSLWGNAFLEVDYSGAGQVRGLWPLRPDRMRVKRVSGQLRYFYRMPERADVSEVELPAIRVMHVRGLGFDGVLGYDPVSLARNTIGLALATEEFGSRFFSNGAQTGTVYQHPGQLTDKAYNRLERSIEKRHQGLENAHRIMILEEGMKAEQVGIPPNNAQFLETRKFQVPEIARWFRMPLHKIQELERATFSNIEHQAIEFVVDTLQPWLTRWEQAVVRDLLTQSERRQYFAEHLIDALLKGDTKSRFEAYAVARQNGWLSANDIRELENMNPVDGGDVYLVPLNMIPADMVGEMPDSPPPDDVRNREQRGLDYEIRAQNLARARLRMAGSYERVLRDAARRVIRREVADVKRAVGKFLLNRTANEFSVWLREFYSEHRQFWVRQFMPILLSLADQAGVAVADELGGEADTAEQVRQFIQDYTESLGNREGNSSELQIQALLDEALANGDDPVAAIDERVEAWAETRPAQVARHESRNAFNAFAIAFYQRRNIQRLVWRSVGDSCPYCTDLDGKEAHISGYFLEAGVEFEPEGADRPLSRHFNVRHGPLHDGCDCQTMAA